jgi:putative phage-type endonuclease
MTTRDEWLAARRRGIGASESAGVLGVSPWSSPLSVWASKIHGDAVEENEAMRWGTLLEPVVLAEYQERTGRTVTRHDQAVSLDHPDFERTHMTATPDGYDADGRVVQVKTTSAYMKDEWADGEAPLHYRVQLQHELAVTGRDAGALVVLIGGQELRIVEETRNVAFVEALEEACARFWRDFVEPRVMPPATATPADIRALERLHPSDSGETVELPPEAAIWDVRLAEIGEVLKALGEEKERIQNQLRAAIGGATYGSIPGAAGRWSWKHQDRKEYTVAAGTMRVLRRLKK